MSESDDKPMDQHPAAMPRSLEDLRLHHPWMLAVWPGMGSIAMTAGFYLIAKLHMDLMGEFVGPELFDVDHIEINGGLVGPARVPRSRFFVWQDPQQQRDLVIFVGESQAPVGKYAFCHTLLNAARQLGIERVFSFAAMATPMPPGQVPRVFGIATDQEALDELKRLEVDPLESGRINGLNGVLLSAAAERGVRGVGLLGEMPYLAPQLPYPHGALAVLEVFCTLAGIDVDLEELQTGAQLVDEQLEELLQRMQEHAQESRDGDADEDDEDSSWSFDPPEEAEAQATEPEEDRPVLSDQDIEKLESLFVQAKANRSKAFVLKQELDRLGVFDRYEDRFLDLFKKS